MMKHTNWRTAVSWLVTVGLALLTLSLAAGLASAHTTTVTKSDPPDKAVLAKAPAQVMAQFSEELDTKGSTMIVKDAAGTQVSADSGKVDLNDPNHATMLTALPAALPGGVYTVAWHALLTHGDASDGTFTFTVQAAAQATAAAPTLVPTVAAATAVTAAPTVAATVETTQAVSAASPTSDTAAGASATAPSPAKLPATGAAEGSPVWPLAAGLAGLLILIVFGASRALRRTLR